MAACVAAVAGRALLRGYKKFESNVIFLLNALENGDYSFRFSESGVAAASHGRREVNAVLNVIKELLARAREQEIENERFLGIIVAAMPVGIAIVDGRDFVRAANDAALRLLGMHVFTHVRQLGMADEALERTFRELVPGRRATVRVADEREERQVSLLMSRITVGRGELRVVAMHNIAGELEEREMESWIKLIRVMTHEIMNSIAPITSLSETMLAAWDETGEAGGKGPTARSGDGTEGAAVEPRETGTGEAGSSVGGEEGDRLRRNTMDAFETINATTRGLLSFVESYRRFTGIPRPVLQPVDLAGLVGRVVALEAATFDARGITVETRFGVEGTERGGLGRGDAVGEDIVAGDPGTVGGNGAEGGFDAGSVVSADEGQVAQVLVNLLKNAAEAISERRTDGRIEVAVSRDGDTVRLDVTNNGEPIPAEVLPHIFVPFFTTKQSGTGIGLSISRHIMRLHGGNLKHHAEGGRTRFSMLFPVP
jgi:signal transduction histidine kinase